MSIIAGLAPVFAVILLGYVLRRRQALPDAFWPSAEQLTFYVFFPALLVTSTARARLADPALAGMVAAIVTAIVAVVAVVCLLRRSLRLDGPTFTSAVQSAIRPNVYVAIATAAALYGSDGLTTISLGIAAVVPLVNAVSVVVLVRHGGEGSGAGRGIGAGSVARQVVRNPLIVACGVGIALNAAGLGLPPLIQPLLEILGRAALPLGLLAVGAGLDPAAIRGSGRVVAAAAVLKLLVLPALTMAICRLFAVEGLPAAAAVLLASLPVSASAYVMARQMGGNAPVMAATISVTTIAAVVTMPIVLSLLA
jgi:hypothetical protein